MGGVSKGQMLLNMVTNPVGPKKMLLDVRRNEGDKKSLFIIFYYYLFILQIYIYI